MVKLSKLVEFISGSPQFRIKEAFDKEAPLYRYYGQFDLEDDLVSMVSNTEHKKIRTYDEVNTLDVGDVLFSLVSGMATIVRKEHKGYLYTQNFVKFIPNGKIDANYLVYLLNENQLIKKRLVTGLQGSQVLKYTLKQVRDLKLPKLPSIQKQQTIGELYFNQLRLQALKKRAATAETRILLSKLEEVRKHE